MFHAGPVDAANCWSPVEPCAATFADDRETDQLCLQYATYVGTFSFSKLTMEQAGLLQSILGLLTFCSKAVGEMSECKLYNEVFQATQSGDGQAA